MRDKFLTEAMGYKYEPNSCFGKYIPTFLEEIRICDTLTEPFDFSTWQGFGKLWEWAQEQEWWAKFHHSGIVGIKRYAIVHPDRFADALYEFLKERT